MKRLLLIILTLCSSNAIADYPLYEGDYGELAVRGELSTVTMFQGNNWLGNRAEGLDDIWAEISIEPAILGAGNLPGGSQFYGVLSYLYIKNFGHDSSGLTLGIEADADEGEIEEGYVGWRSGTFLKEYLGENAIDISVGRQDYQLGSGFLLYDGASDGGDNAGWWLATRNSFKNTLIARINVAGLKLEGFHLETRRARSLKTAFGGMNIEYQYKDIGNIGFSYINVSQDPFIKGTDVYNARTEFSPLKGILPGLTLQAEYAFETKEETFQSEGGYGQVSYLFSDTFWEPKLTYRYTGLQDDFNSLAYGFSDWGTWYQGEITGEYVLDHSNSLTHMIRLTLAPNENMEVNLMYFHIDFDDPLLQPFNIIGDTPIIAKHYGDEINLIVDLTINDHVTITGAIEAFIPGEGAKQMFGNGNKTWVQGMIYTSFGF